MQIIFMEQITHVTKYNKDNDIIKLVQKFKNAVREVGEVVRFFSDRVD